MMNTQRPLRIAFMTTCGRNVGDEFIREGIRSFFDELLPSYNAFYVDKHDLTTLQRQQYDEIERLGDKFRQADIIVQAGAPVYWSNGRYTSWNADWAEALWEDRIFRARREQLVFNLGAGAGQKSEDDLQTLLDDTRLCQFARQAALACAWTAVRDPLASQFLRALCIQHELLPCPAFHAARRVCGHGQPPPPQDLLAVNLMRLAGHYRLKPETDPDNWRTIIDQFLPELRREHRLIFVAHDAAEAEFQRDLAQDDEMVFLASDYRDYLSLYSRVKGIVANRVHAAVCVAGFGRPAVIIGNDCRIGIARPIGIPAIDSADATAEWILDQLAAQFDDVEDLQAERLSLRESSAQAYLIPIAAALRCSQLKKAA